MQGNIDFIGSLTGSIAGGGGGGSDVTITPTLATGTKIADYTIDSESGSLYAPTPQGLTAELPLEISDNVISIDLSDYATVSDLDDYQEKLTAGNYININSSNEISCTPPITNVWYTPEAGVQQDVLIGKFTVNEVTQNVYAPSGGTIWDYSTSEVDTGQKWTDNKNLFVKTFQGQLTISTTNRTWYDVISNLSYMDKVFVMPESYIELSDAIINIPYTSYFNNVGAVVGANYDTPSHTFQLLIGGLPVGTYDYEITLKYTKSV